MRFSLLFLSNKNDHQSGTIARGLTSFLPAAHAAPIIFEAPPTKNPTSAMSELAAALVGGELFSPTRLGTALKAIANTTGDL